ncbi:acyl-CoA-like ligand-binding transcription factor [Mycobacterium sp. C31M]
MAEMTEPIPLNIRKRQATRYRIAAAAAALVAADGLAATTVERIAAEAQVGRATFFRYFAAKEDAVADGMTRHWLDVITASVAAQPPELSARDAVVAAFVDLGDGFEAISGQVRDLATLTRSSPTLNAWTLQIYVGYEGAIADLVAPRFTDLAPDDPRPRLIGALAMASVRIALDDWLAHGGSLPQRVRTALGAISVG